MTLYHYVRTKDELLTLVIDAVMGEVMMPAGESVPSDWRCALTNVAERTRAASRTTRGSSTSPTIRPSGPNTACATSTSRCRRSARSDPRTHREIDIVSAVDEYVFGYCLHHRNNQMTGEQTFDDDARLAYVNGLVSPATIRSSR